MEEVAVDRIIELYTKKKTNDGEKNSYEPYKFLEVIEGRQNITHMNQYANFISILNKRNQYHIYSLMEINIQR